MSKSTARVMCLLLAVAIVAVACGVDEPGSPAVALDSTTSTTEAPIVESVDAVSAAPTSTTIDALAFNDTEEAEVQQQLWNDATSVSTVWTIGQSDPDGPIDVVAGFTVGQGLTARWPDESGDDFLVMFQRDQIYQAFRVGNEVFIAEVEPLQEGLFSEYFFAELLFTLLEPLETGQLPDGAFTFVEADGVSYGPSVVYALPPNESAGVITADGDIQVTRQGPEVTYTIPDGEVTLSREDVGNSTNTILRDWYLDQAG